MNGCGHFSFTPDDPDCRDYGLGAAALRYASLGFAVLPLARGAKRPHRMLGPSGGVHHASTDYRKVREWWAQDRAANIGVACGTPSSLVVVDLDVKGDGNGLQSWHAWLRWWGGQPPFPGAMTTTPSGGQHIWLRWPARYDMPVPERPGILPGVDIKGDGGYVVAPPSMLLLGGNREGDPVPVPYIWHGCPCSAPQAPSWMPGWLTRAPAHGGGTAGGQDYGDPPDFEAALRDGFPAGERNGRMYRLACSRLARHGTGDAGFAEVVAELRAVWERCDTRDYRWSEVMTSVTSARRWMQRQEAAEIEVARLWTGTAMWPGRG